jgi:hypothetical protein
MNLQQHIRNVLREESSVQIKLMNMINNHNIKTASMAVGGIDNLLKILKPNDEELNEFIYQYLTEEYHPDYGWGPELHDFYKEDVRIHGSYEFPINDRIGYAYLGEWDGYDYLHTLMIAEWLTNELTSLFGDKWIPVFKQWFEDNSGLEVREIDLDEKYFSL